MINFLVPNGSYGMVIKGFIEPITRQLDLINHKYKTSIKAEDNCVNVMFFTENGVWNTFKLKNGLGTNVFMTHGIADKNWRGAISTNKFDYVFVTGTAWIDKLVNEGMSKNKILLGGYTRLDDLFNMQKDYKKEFDNGKKTILFAPTHTNGVTSYGKLDKIIENLKKDYNVLVSSHPFNNKKKFTTTEFLEADVIVGDFGSSMYEGWALGKPSVLPSWLVKGVILDKFTNSFEGKIYREEIGYHAQSEKDFYTKIKSACENGITEKESQFVEGILNTYLRGMSGKFSADCLVEIDRYK